MSCQVIFKQYKESRPVKEERWLLSCDLEEQIRNLHEFPVRVRCTRKSRDGVDEITVEAQMLGTMDEPVSLTLEYIKDGWKRTEYVFLPGAVYDGNRMKSKKIPYPPYHAGRTDGRWDSVITDIPHLDREKTASEIQFRSGDMTTPAMGYFDRERKTGEFILAGHEIDGMYSGFTVSEREEKAFFRVSVPAVREEKKYFFGELPDGSGFYPTCDYPSDDEGMILKPGGKIRLEVRKYRILAETIPGYLRKCNELRETLEQGKDFDSIPFSTAYGAVKAKYLRSNFTEEGYYRVGTENEAAPSYWQAGWVGGGMNTYPFLLEDHGTAAEQAVSTLRFIVEKLQRENGWYVPMYAKGKAYGDAFRDGDTAVLLVRKDADLLYFLLKQAFFLREKKVTVEGLEESIRRQADAFVRFVKKNGQLGQFIDMEKEEILGGDTASAAIAPAALALASEYFRNESYLETARLLGEQYLEALQRGVVNGGPGEICQAPDSESAFALLESCVQLYETTNQKEWLQAAKEAFELAVTWVMSYDFHFPEGTTASTLGCHTRGTVFANAQNKHSAPGICTLSGNSMLKLYRFTGNEKYLEWLRRISHALSQFVSLPGRPVRTLEGRPLPPGYFNERVQTCDWEGKETVGEFLYGSNWPEVTMFLTYVEVPGIYVDLEKSRVCCMDHVKAELTGEAGEEVLLKISNPTKYDAAVTILADGCREKRLGHDYFEQMEIVRIPAGEERIWKAGRREEK